MGENYTMPNRTASKGAAGFKRDLSRANDLENRLKSYLEANVDCTVSTSQGFGSYSDWDLQIEYPDGTKTWLEVKEDKQVAITQNIAVEFERHLSTGIRPTCISVTKSDFFVYFFDNYFHFIETSKLKELLADNTTHFTTFGGDGGTAKCAIFKKILIQGITIQKIKA